MSPRAHVYALVGIGMSATLVELHIIAPAVVILGFVALRMADEICRAIRERKEN